MFGGFPEELLEQFKRDYEQLPEDVRAKVKAALLSLNDPANKELLKSVYGAEGFVERGHDEHVEALKKAIDSTKLDIPIDKPKK